MSKSFAPMDWPIAQLGPRAIVYPNQKDWARTNAYARRTIFERTLRLLEEREEEIADAIIDELGGTRVKAGFELEGVLRSYGAFEKHAPLLGQRFDWAIYGRVRSERDG